MSSGSILETTVDNGMKLVLYESHKVPLVTIVITVKAGALTEKPNTNGLTHLWEHMFFKGNKKLENQAAFKKRVRQLGIDYNGDTSAEKVRYYITLPSSFLEDGLEFMADAIATPLLDQEELDREIKVVLNEYERNASSPLFEFINLSRFLIYGADKQHLRDPLGTPKIITSTTREILYDIKDKTMVPENSALIIGGDIDPVKTKELVNKHFKIWQTPKNWQPIPDLDFGEFPSEYKDMVLINDNVPVPYALMFFDGPRAGRERQDTFVADVFSSLLSHENGKFQKKFMDSGLVLDASVGYQTQSQSGGINIIAQAHNSKVVEAKAALLKEIELWAQDDYFTDEQLEDVKRNFLIEGKMERNSPSSFTKSLAFWWPVTGIDYFNDYLTKVSAVTLDDVQQFAKDWLVEKPYLGAIILSSKDSEKIRLKENVGDLIEEILVPVYGPRTNLNTAASK